MDELDISRRRHFHIRWNGATEPDWQPFLTRDEAEALAGQIRRSSEGYTIEEFDHACTRCERLMQPKLAPQPSPRAKYGT